MQSKSLVLVLILVSVFVLLLGCTDYPNCGDGVCNGDETSDTCPADCGVGAGMLEVNVLDIETGSPIGGAYVTVYETTYSESGCGISVDDSPIAELITDSSGKTKLEVKEEKYVAVIASAEDYDTSNTLFQCATIKKGKWTGLWFDLNKLPPKKMCTQEEGTIEMAVGETAIVLGGGKYEGKKMILQLTDFMKKSSSAGYVPKWLLMDPTEVPIKYVELTPPADLGDAFGNDYIGQQVNLLENCWVKGESLPRAVIEILSPHVEECCSDWIVSGSHGWYVDWNIIGIPPVSGTCRLKFTVDELNVSSPTELKVYSGTSIIGGSTFPRTNSAGVKIIKSADGKTNIGTVEKTLSGFGMDSGYLTTLVCSK